MSVRENSSNSAQRTGERSPAPRRRSDSGRAKPQKRGDATREQLLSSARAVGGRKPYPRIVIEDITQDAGTSRATFYLYFENKDDIYLELVRETCDTLYTAAGDSWAAGSAAGAIRQATEGYAEQFVANAEVIGVLYTVAPTDPRFHELLESVRLRFYARIERNLARGIEAGIFRPVDAALTSRMLGGMVESFFAENVARATKRQPIEPAVEVLSDLWYHAIKAPDGSAAT